MIPHSSPLSYPSDIFSFYIVEYKEGGISPLRVTSIVTKTKFTVPAVSIINVPVTSSIHTSNESESVRQKTRSKQSDPVKPKSVNRGKKLNQHTERRHPEASVIRPTSLPSMSSGGNDPYCTYTGVALTPPESPAINYPVPRNFQGEYSTSMTSKAQSVGCREQTYHVTGGNSSPSAIEGLVEQHFNNCGLGGFIANAKYHTHSPSRRHEPHHINNMNNNAVAYQNQHHVSTTSFLF